MGVSSDGQLCYGIGFDDGYHFPWSDEEWGDDIESWWFRGVCCYSPPFEIYTSDGEYIDGVAPSNEKVDEYYEHYREFKVNNAMPVEIVTHCSYDYTMYIVAALGTYVRSSRGYVERIELDDVCDESVQAVINFCEKYCKPMDEYYKFPEMKPSWLLSSMYG